MSITRRIYFSVPTTTWRDDQEIGLTDFQQHLIEGLAKKVDELGYTVQVFARFGIPSDPTIAATKWSYEKVERVMRRCVGAVFIGLPRWILTTPADVWRLATEYSYFEAGMAVTLGLSRLVVVEEALLDRVVFSKSYEFIASVPQGAGPAWLESPAFQHAFQGWQQRLEERRDIFLGYCSSSTGLAKNIKLYLQHQGATVLDWQTDFVPGGTILEQIQQAARLCSAGIFLFTKDDKLAVEGEGAAPRDNVVFEAGYFAAAKGKERVLIVRETGSKMPADLGGDVYAALDDRSDISSIEHSIQKFLEERL